ncbi:nuclear transport factor 2 family protein [Novosphingobium sp. Fuku2-ISO-50]|uniref:nuclear transport factor 2 family protein n=1 Tax=Novosphingobium sp. Fuku2-ISO-50 TaxID=1739114 RepID=UPI000AD3485F|nr:nuclear transport factor 2 family protein [Novosphingobium sp. Fuku2-ISO-50]
MTPNTDIPTILNTLHDAFHGRDMDTIGRYFDEHAQIVTPDGVMQGRAAKISDELRVFEMFDDCSIEVTSTVVQGNEAVEFSHLRGVAKIGPLSGSKVEMRYVVLYRFSGDKITFQEICFDRLALATQLGMAA